MPSDDTTLRDFFSGGPDAATGARAATLSASVAEPKQALALGRADRNRVLSAPQPMLANDQLWFR